MGAQPSIPQHPFYLLAPTSLNVMIVCDWENAPHPLPVLYLGYFFTVKHMNSATRGLRITMNNKLFIFTSSLSFV